MSRTKRGAKSCGFDYWSKRTHKLMSPGKAAKRDTKRAERRRGKKEIRSYCELLLGIDV